MKIEAFQRTTRQRRVILEELRKLKTHPSATDLYEIVRQKLPRISLGTVYRNLELLASSGEILKLESGGGQARFDGNPEHHHHVRCSVCGRVDDVHQPVGDDALGKIGTLEGYRIADYRLEFIGVCPQCREHSASKA